MDFSVCTYDASSSPDGNVSPSLPSMLSTGRRRDILDCLSMIEAKCLAPLSNDEKEELQITGEKRAADISTIKSKLEKLKPRPGEEGSFEYFHRNEILTVLSRFLKICYDDENKIPPEATLAIGELITVIDEMVCEESKKPHDEFRNGGNKQTIQRDSTLQDLERVQEENHELRGKLEALEKEYRDYKRKQETVFGNITNEHRALKEKYFSTRKQENNNRDGNAMGGGNGSGSGSNDRDDEGDEGGPSLPGVDDNSMSIEAEVVGLRKEKIQYEDLISKQEQYIDETERIVNRANAERDAQAQTVELMKVEIEGKDSEITQLKLQLKRASVNAASSSSSIASSPKSSPTLIQNSDTDALRTELDKRMSESVEQANELKRVKDLVNTQIAGINRAQSELIKERELRRKLQETILSLTRQTDAAMSVIDLSGQNSNALSSTNITGTAPIKITSQGMEANESMILNLERDAQGLHF